MKKLELNASKQNLIIHIILTVVTLAVYWQVNYYDFIIEDKPHLVEGSYVQYGITMEGIRWAFSTTYYYLWQPLFWLSFMFDYHLYGLNAGGYHLTNLVLHIFNTLLLFGLLNRMTADVWKSFWPSTSLWWPARQPDAWKSPLAFPITHPGKFLGFTRPLKTPPSRWQAWKPCTGY